MLDALMQDRPPLPATEVTIRSRNSLPLGGPVGAEDDLAIAGAVDLDPRIAQPGAHRGPGAEEHRGAALPQDHARPVVP